MIKLLNCGSVEMAEEFWLSDMQWTWVAPLLPNSRGWTIEVRRPNGRTLGRLTVHAQEALQSLHSLGREGGWSDPFEMVPQPAGRREVLLDGSAVGARCTHVSRIVLPLATPTETDRASLLVPHADA